MKTPIYKWSGNFWGFVYNGRLFDKNANYNGWIDDQGRAWNKYGSYLGEIVQENYILRNASRVEPVKSSKSCTSFPDSANIRMRNIKQSLVQILYG